MFHDLLSIDGSLVPYYGRHSCKMFIKGKPIRFGYRLWCLCGSDGYRYYLILYQGKDTTRNKEPLDYMLLEKWLVLMNNTQNLHIMYCSLTSVYHLEFRRHIKMTFSQSRSRLPKGATYPTNESRHDGFNHCLCSRNKFTRLVQSVQEEHRDMITQYHIRLHSERGEMCLHIFHKVA